VIVVVSIILAPSWSGSLTDAESLECLDVYRTLLAALRQSPIHHDGGHPLYSVLPGFRLGRFGLHVVNLQVAAFADDGADCHHRLIANRTTRCEDFYCTLCHYMPLC
jgi:hypothetical protein